jgi:hypothetical protein
MTTCRSKRNAQERIVKVRDLIERWNKGVSMLNRGEITPTMASMRFDKLANEILALSSGHESIPEIDFLLGQWMSAQHENTPEQQRQLLAAYYEKWDDVETGLEQQGLFDKAWREGFDAAILPRKGEETS